MCQHLVLVLNTLYEYVFLAKFVGKLRLVRLDHLTDFVLQLSQLGLLPLQQL